MKVHDIEPYVHDTVCYTVNTEDLQRCLDHGQTKLSHTIWGIQLLQYSITLKYPILMSQDLVFMVTVNIKLGINLN